MVVQITQGMSASQVRSALAGASNGEVVEWEPGDYRLDETLTTSHLKQGAVWQSSVPGEKARLKGSVLLTNWVDEGGGLWSHDITGFISDDPHDHGVVDVASARQVEDLFIDGQWMREVDSLGDVQGTTYTDDPRCGPLGLHFPGTYWVDRGSTPRVWTAIDPSQHDYEWSWLNRLVDPGSTTDTTFIDMGFHHAANRAQTAPISRAGSGQKFHRCDFTYNHGCGIHTRDNSEYWDCNISFNGQLGMGGSGDNVIVAYCLFEENNQAQYRGGWEAGGTKWSNADGMVIKYNVCRHNWSYSLWTDINNINILYEGNWVYENVERGILHEISYAWEARLNVCERNSESITWSYFDPTTWGWGGQIVNQNSLDAVVHDNVLIGGGSGRDVLTIIEQGHGGRGHDGENGEEPGPHGFWTSQNGNYHHNFIVFEANSGQCGIFDDDEGVAADSATNPWDDNYYYGPSGFQTSDRWENRGLHNRSEWQADGYDPNSTFTDGSLTPSATILSGDLTDTEIRNGTAVVEVELFGNWLNDRVGDDDDVTAAVIDALTATSSPSAGWNNVVKPALETAHVSLVAGTKADGRIFHTLRVEVPAVPSYTVDSNETLEVAVAGEGLVKREDMDAGSLTIEATEPADPAIAGDMPVALTLAGALNPLPHSDVVRTEAIGEFTHPNVHEDPALHSRVITVPEGTELLLVAVLFKAHESISSISWNGGTLALIANENAGAEDFNNRQISVYGLDAPTPGSANIEIVSASEGWDGYAVLAFAVSGLPAGDRIGQVVGTSAPAGTLTNEASLNHTSTDPRSAVMALATTRNESGPFSDNSDVELATRYEGGTGAATSGETRYWAATRTQVETTEQTTYRAAYEGDPDGHAFMVLELLPGPTSPPEVSGDLPIGVTMAGALQPRVPVTGDIPMTVALAGALEGAAKQVAGSVFIAVSLDLGKLRGRKPIAGDMPVNLDFGGEVFGQTPRGDVSIRLLFTGDVVPIPAPTTPPAGTARPGR